MIMLNAKCSGISRDFIKHTTIVAVLVFTAVILVFYEKKFDLKWFCIMNVRDSLCSSQSSKLAPQIDCLTRGSQNTTSNVAYQDDTFGFIKIGTVRPL